MNSLKSGFGITLAVVLFSTSHKLCAQGAPSAKDETLTRQEIKEAILDQEIELMRKDLRAVRRQVVAANLPLTTEESTKFWPVYDEYIAEMTKINDGRYALIKDYAQNYKTLTDEQAASFIRRWVDADKKIVDLRLKYIPQMEKVLSEKKTAMFAQIDRRVQFMIELQLARQVPLVNPQ